MWTKAERLRIWRRRQRLTQKQIARMLGIAYRTYRRLETGEANLRQYIDIDLPINMTPGEQIYLHRKRRGIHKPAFARYLDIHERWLYKIENIEGFLTLRELVEVMKLLDWLDTRNSL